MLDDALCYTINESVLIQCIEHEDKKFSKSIRLSHSSGLQCIIFYLYMYAFSSQTVFIFTWFILQKFFSFYFTYRITLLQGSIIIGEFF